MANYSTCTASESTELYRNAHSEKRCIGTQSGEGWWRTLLFKVTTKTGAPCLAVETWVYTASSTARSLPRTTELGACCWNELEAVFLGLLSKFLLYSLMVLQFLLGEGGFVVGVFCGEQVEDDACQFVGCGSDGFGRSEPGAHPSVVLALVPPFSTCGTPVFCLTRHV